MADDPTMKSHTGPPVGIDESLIDLAPRLRRPASSTPIGAGGRLLEAVGVTGERVKNSRDRVLRGIADQFLEFTRHGPTVLILDELHRADEQSLEAVEFLANQLQDRTLWILATSRPFNALSELGRVRLTRFEMGTHAQQIVLYPFSPVEVAKFLRVTQPAREFSAEEVTRRHAETGGNPLLLEQLARRISSGGRVPKRGGGPSTPLDEEAQRTLDAAAALGPEFTFDLLRFANGADGDRLKKVVDSLVDAGLLFERPSHLLEFPEDRLREEAYQHLSESKRRVLHQRAGESREAVESEGSTRIFGLARDFYLGKVDKRSIKYNLVAAEIAERSMAPDIARDFLARALESHRDLDPEDREGDSDIQLDLGRITYELGRLQEAEGIFRNFLEASRDDRSVSPGIRASFEIYLARVLTARGDLVSSSQLAEKVLSSSGLDDQPLVLIGAHAHLALALYYDGHYIEALAHQTEVIRLAREARNEAALAQAHLWHAGCLAMLGQAEPALTEAREVAAAFDRLGSVGKSAEGHLFLGNMLADNRSTPLIRQEATTELEKAIRLGERAQDPRRVGWAYYHLAELLRTEKRLDEALSDAQRAHDTLGRIGDRAGQALSLKVRGQIAMDRGAYNLAEPDLVEAQRMLHGLNQTLNDIDVLLRLAQLLAARGDRNGALHHIAELKRLNLTTVRPDLVAEFEQLKLALDTK
ncbi:MAG: ATP-binding protein [Thermoplasmata archaeon]